MSPLAIELFAGTGSGTAGWCELGGTAACFDLEYLDHHGKPLARSHRVIQDVLTVHGSQFKDAAWIWASPPCQKYSYLAMPWSRSTDPENSKAAKALRKKWETEGPDNRLFDACFRIQREAIEATQNVCPGCDGTGHEDDEWALTCDSCGGLGWTERRYIPLIVENVRGAVPWVGKRDMPLDEWNRLTQAEKIQRGRPQAMFGSFYLFGDVAQIGNRVVAGRDLADIRAGRGRFGMGVAPERVELKGHGSTWFGIQNNGDRYDQREVNPVSGANKVPGFRFDGGGRNFQTASVESQKGAWDNNTPGRLRRDDSLNFGNGVKVSGQIQGKELGHVNKRDGHGHTRHLTNQAESDAVRREAAATKQPAGRGDWFSKEARDGGASARFSSKSNARKAASALIAKIPYALSRYIAEQHYPAELSKTSQTG